MNKAATYLAVLSLASNLIGCAGTEQDSDLLDEETGVETSSQALTVTESFDTVANGTVIDQLYLGVTFTEPLHGGHVYAVQTIGSTNLGISIHDPNSATWRSGASTFASEEGAVDATFGGLQQTVSISARMIEALECLGCTKKPFLQAFDSNGQYLETVYYPTSTPNGWQTLTISRPTADIKRVRFSSQNNWAGLANCPTSGCPTRMYGGHYAEFDNLSYDNGIRKLRPIWRPLPLIDYPILLAP